MIEIFLMVKLVRSIGNLLRTKGRSPGGYQFLAVFLWIACEFIGSAIGVAADLGAGTYGLALIGAATGAGLAWTIASAAAPGHVDSDLGEVFE